MECVICKNGTMTDGFVTVTLQRGGSVIVIKNVPAFVCENCGEYKLSETTAAKVMQIAGDSATRHVEIEVLQFAA
ncbi:MAG: type II toxin-antitoxin system MqsA family antitoxin [Balneolaceae bacterium]|nr:type II toxin-antitoxin system MqsA family antitoxin [Balneolaceae bacterium]